MLRVCVRLGAVLLIVLGGLHAVYVARAEDVEPYLWGGSAFLVAQGVLTWVYLRSPLR